MGAEGFENEGKVRVLAAFYLPTTRRNETVASRFLSPCSLTPTV